MFILLVCLLGIGCDKTCPEDVNLGNIYLKPSSGLSIPYKDAEVISFINENKDTLYYEVSMSKNEDRPVYLGHLCETKNDQALQIATTTGIHGNLHLRGAENIPDGFVQSFTFRLLIKNLNQKSPLDTLFVDNFSICSVIKKNGSSIQKTPYHIFNLIVNKREVDSKSVSSYTETDFLEEVTLNDKSFFSVYRQGLFSKFIYYTFPEGIIGFRDENDVLWVKI